MKEDIVNSAVVKQRSFLSPTVGQVFRACRFLHIINLISYFMYKKQLMKQREVLREDMFAGIISPRQYRILDEKVRHKLKEWNMANNNRSK